MSKIEKESGIPPETSNYLQVRGEKGKKVTGLIKRNSDLPTFRQQLLESATMSLDWHCSADRENTQCVPQLKVRN